MTIGCEMTKSERIAVGWELHSAEAEKAVYSADEHVAVLVCTVGSARCKDTSRYFNEGSSCYVFYDDPQTWHEARNRCLRNGGDLASFITTDSNVGLSKLVTSTHWIGLRSSWWTWLDRKERQYCFKFSTTTQ